MNRLAVSLLFAYFSVVQPYAQTEEVEARKRVNSQQFVRMMLETDIPVLKSNRNPKLEVK